MDRRPWRLLAPGQQYLTRRSSRRAENGARLSHCIGPQLNSSHSLEGHYAMDTAIISALSAVLGSLVGGSATIATAWVTQKTQSRRELVGAEIRKRELLYTEFIAECSRLAIDAFGHTLERPETVLPSYALLNRIRLTSSDAVLAAAEQTIKNIAEQYFAPQHVGGRNA